MRNLRVSVGVGAVVIALLGTACGQSDGGESTKGSTGPVEQVPAGPVVAAADLDQFSAALLREVSKEQPENVVVSPASLALAFALAEAGAQGATRDEIRSVFGFDQRSDISAVLTAITAPPISGAPVLSVANGVWDTGRRSIDASYKATVQDTLKSELSTVPYPQLAKAVNSWVSDQTKGRITDLVPDAAVNIDTVAILVNAIYLLAKWQYPFRDDGAQAFAGAGMVPMMSVEAAFQIAEGDGYRAIRLPYQGGTVSMLIVVPDNITSFDPARLTDVRTGLGSTTQVQLTMPTWDFATQLAAKSTLSRLGITTAFTGRADFCPMITGSCQAGDMRISEVFHQANITVDTEGTEAAAATAIVIEGVSARIDEPRTFTVDRPFLFEIVHEATGTPLFIGRVVNPAA